MAKKHREYDDVIDCERLLDDEAPDDLILIDIQKGFINHNTTHIPALVESVQEYYKHVYHMVFDNPNTPDSPYRNFIPWDKMEKYSDDWQLAYKPKYTVNAPHSKTNIYEKHTYAAFTPEIQEIVSARGIKSIAIAGINTEICVFQTALAIFNYGVRPIILSGICGSRKGAATHKFGMTTIMRSIGGGQVW